MIDSQRATGLKHLAHRIAEAAARFARAEARLHDTIPDTAMAYEWLDHTLAGHPGRHALLQTAKEQVQKLLREEIRRPPSVEKTRPEPEARNSIG